MTWWCVCNNRCLPKCLVPVIATVVLESVIRLPVWLAVDLRLLLPLHSSLTLPGRTRSLPGKGYSLQDLNSVDKFLKAVLDERGWELYFEGNRRQDLIRYGLFVEAIKKKAQSMGKQTLVDEDRYRFPIPQDIIDEGQGIIKQNPGY